MRIKLFIILILFSICSNAEDRIDSIRKKVKEIDQGIIESKENINISKKEEQRILKKLSEIEKDLINTTQEYSEVSEQYKVTSRNIEYAEKNLEVIDEELYLKKKNYAEILMKVNKKIYSVDSTEYNIQMEFEKEDVKKALDKTKEKIGNINYVKAQVKEVQSKISNEKTELISLRRELANKREAINSKKKEHASLVKQLKNKQSYYNSQIVKLREQRIKSEKEIERIIQERVKMSGNYNIKVILEELGYMQYPLEGKISLYYGEEKLNDIKSQGIKINSRLGAMVKSANRGTIVFSEKFEGLGTMIIIDHGYNLVSIYGNLIRTYVKEGDVVGKGDAIGILGLSTDREPELYFETRLSARSVDPKTFLEN